MLQKMRLIFLPVPSILMPPRKEKCRIDVDRKGHHWSISVITENVPVSEAYRVAVRGPHSLRQFQVVGLQYVSQRDCLSVNHQNRYESRRLIIIIGDGSEVALNNLRDREQTCLDGRLACPQKGTGRRLLMTFWISDCSIIGKLT